MHLPWKILIFWSIRLSVMGLWLSQGGGAFITNKNPGEGAFAVPPSCTCGRAWKCSAQLHLPII